MPAGETASFGERSLDPHGGEDAIAPPAAEAARILAEYERREKTLPTDFYALHHPANLFTYHAQQRALLRALRRAQLIPLAQRSILDIGCGHGQWMGLFVLFGADQRKLTAIDLNEERVAAARARYPEADIRVADAGNLPWPSATFDIVSQSMVFTSVLDRQHKQRMAAEMLRVLKPGGAIVWYDFLFNNPRNPHVAGIGLREIDALFPGCQRRLQRVTLAPPLARRLVPLTWPFARLLEKFVILNTHYLGTIRPKVA